MKQHAASLWQCDFFSQKVLTLHGTRRVIMSPATQHPNEAWVTEQAKAFVNQAREQGLRVAYVQRDRDTKYAGFDATVKRLRVKALQGPVATPTSRAYVESFIGSVRRECLNHFLFLGITHLDSVLKTWLGYYHRQRPHQGVENELLIKPKAPRGRKKRIDEPSISRAEIRCEQQLGRLLKSYYPKAAYLLQFIDLSNSAAKLRAHRRILL